MELGYEVKGALIVIVLLRHWLELPGMKVKEEDRKVGQFLLFFKNVFRILKHERSPEQPEQGPLIVFAKILAVVFS